MQRRLRRFKKSIMSAGGVLLALVMVVAMVVGTTTEVSATTVTDTGTMDSWSATTGDNTENIGRIWTDKSVFSEDTTLPGDSDVTIQIDDEADFLVALSALSSTAHITGETSTSQPLDIVLVLDRSGSMAYDMTTTTTYEEVYASSLNTRNTYYVLVDGTYYSVSYSNGGRGQTEGWYYGSGNNRTYVTPLTSSTDTTSGSVQFYTATTETTTRMEALQSAVNSFIEYTYTLNQSISSVEDQHQISIVSYASDYSTAEEVTTHCGLTAVNSSTVVSTLESYVNNMNALGATRSDSGLSAAKDVILGDSARSNAKKVVIFFTDGVPTTASTFDATVANNAVSYAKDMKDAGVTIYSIGIFSGADTSDPTTITNNSSETDRANSFMHAVSSNYPLAAAYNNLGTRATDSDYYKAASDAAELESIFTAIATEITESVAQSPTHVESDLGFHNSGYITFTDTLGDYMEVLSFSEIVYNDTVHTSQSSTTETTDTGTITTYVFSDLVTANALVDGEQEELAHIIITVESFNDVSKGDVVTVQIPANLIPLRYYDVEVNEDGTATTTITEAHPIRLFYNVKVKDEVETLLANPDETMQAYIDANTDENGEVRFYANKYESDDNTNVTSSFVPASTNNFYYFQEDEILYTRSGTEGNYTYTVATSFDSSETYYYEREYYVEGTNVAQETYWTAIAGDSALALRGYILTNADGQLYVASGTPRLSSLEARFEQFKTTNTTSTAEYVIDPDWEYNNTTVTNALGNNGYVTYSVPGTLVVEKDVVNETGHTAASTDTFTFTLTLSDTTGSYSAQIFNSDGTTSGEATTVSNGSKFTLSDGQYIEVYGLADSTTYRVTEDAKTGYTSDQSIYNGTITGGETSTVTVTNTYKAESTTLDGFSVTKSYDGWDQTPSEVFTFVLEGYDNAPMPEGAVDGQVTVTISNGTSESISTAFGSITYDTPGTYTYLIYERRPDTTTAGITYSYARYEVTVTVIDNGGQLRASAEMTKVLADDGITSASDTVTTATFTNVFDAKSESVSILGTKYYTDNTGSNPLVDGMFTFKITLDDNAYNEGKYPSGVTLSRDSTTGKYYYTVTNIGDVFTSGDITFDSDDVNDSYTYTVQEVIPEGATENTDGTYTLNGMTYDTSVYTVTLTIGAQGTGSDAIVVVTRTYTKDNTDWTTEAASTGHRVVFTNFYDATDVTISDTNNGLAVKKFIDGRNLNTGETFTFNLTANSSTISAINNEEVVISGLENASTVTTSDTLGNVTVNALDTATYFSDITFTKVGTYTFYIQEVIPDGATQNADGTYTLNGLTYDTSVITATVTVTDNDGVLAASVSYSSETATTAEFTNVYRSSTYYGNGYGLQVSKTLTGRTMNIGEFSFTITAAEGSPAIASFDASFTNDRQRASGVADVMTKLSTLQFTQDDAGKTYTYTIAETSGTLGGVTYDDTEYTVEITVNDDGEGNITTTTVVTKSNDETYEVTYNSADGDIVLVEFNNTYEPDTPVTLPGSTNLAITKVISGRNWLSSDSFTFVLGTDDTTTQTAIDDGTVVLPDNASGITISASSLSDGSYTAAFGDIKFYETGDYVFKITETSGSIPGMVYAVTPRYVYVTVSDNLDGTLSVEVTRTGLMTFVNTYQAESVAYSNLSVKKILTGRDWLTTDEFTFELTAYNDAAASSNVTLPDSTTITITDETVDNTATFDTITFHAAGTYQFMIDEVEESIPGITYDTSDVIVMINVTDNVTTGKLEISSVSYERINGTNAATTDGNVTFTNTYGTGTTTLNGSTHLDVTKTLSGRDWTTEDSFTFTIEAADNATSKAITDGEVVLGTSSLTLNNDSNHVAGDTTTKTGSFGDIVFHEAGTYTFVVYENIPEAATADNGYTVNGVIYDITEYTITIVVEDDNEGHLDIDFESSTIPDLTFTNAYEPDPVTLPGATNLAVSKTLSGRDWLAEETYQFTITSEVGTSPLPEETTITVGKPDSGNTATASFGDITYTEEGKYVYYITEVTGSNANVTYSQAQYKVVVTVTDNGDGTLAVSSLMTQVKNNAGTEVTSQAQYATASFTNTYDEPDDVKSVTDESGNNLDGAMVGVGDTLTYTIDWINDAISGDGSAAEATVIVYDTIPAGTTLVEDSITGGGTYDSASRLITWNLGTQDAEATGSVSYKVTVNNDAVYDIDNTAYVKIGENDPQATNEVKTYVPYKELETATDSSGNVTTDNELSTGDYLQYVITFNKTQEDTVEVVDELDDILNYVSNDSNHPTTIVINNSTTLTGTDAAPTVSGQTLTWTLEGLDAGTHVEIYFWVQVGSTSSSGDISVTNQATVDGHNSNVTEFPKETTTDKTVYDAAGTTNIENGLVSVGDTVTYEISWVNESEADAEITIVDYLPTGVSVEGTWEIKAGTETTIGSSTSSDGVTYEYNSQLHTATWKFKASATTEGTLTFTAKVNSVNTPDGSITNRATVNGVEVTARIFAPVKTQELNTTAADGTLRVGDTITYTITYHNPATSGSTTVTVTDTVPAGTTIDLSSLAGVTGAEVDSETGKYTATLDDGTTTITYDSATGTITWNLGEKAANASGTVSFTVQVTEDAIGDTVDNQATVQIGSNDPKYTNKTTTDEVDSGNLTIRKTVTGTNAPENAVFTFKVMAADAEGNALTGTYETTNGEITFVGGEAEVTITGEGSITIKGLPEGATYTVTETDLPSGFTNTASSNTSGTIVANATDTARFTNTYKGKDVTVNEGTESADGQYVSVGDTLNYTIAWVNDAQNTDGNATTATITITDTVPAGTTIDLSSLAGVTGAEVDSETGKYTATLDDGTTTITYDSATGTITWNLGEKAANASGTVSFAVTVTEDASSSVTNQATVQVGNNPSQTTNIVRNPVTESTDTILEAKKTLEGRDLIDREFNFGVYSDAECTDEVATAYNDADGNVIFTLPQFTRAGTYTYYMKEIEGKLSGVTYDTNVYSATVTVEDDGNGKLVVSNVTYNTSTGEAPTFVNTYTEADISINLSATKVLQGRTMADGEFRFIVTDENGNTVSIGINKANGTVEFGKIGITGWVEKIDVTSDETDETDETNSTSEDQTGEEESVGSGGDASSEPTTASVEVESENTTVVKTTEATGENVIDNGETTVSTDTEVMAASNEILVVSNDASEGGESSAVDSSGTNTSEPGTSDADNTDNTSGDQTVEEGTADPAGEASNDLKSASDGTSADGSDDENSQESDESGVSAISDDEVTDESTTENETDAEDESEAEEDTSNSTDYWYTISEENTGADGVTYDTTVYKVKVTVYYDENGDLQVSDPVYYKADGVTEVSGVVFTNTYVPDEETSTPSTSTPSTPTSSIPTSPQTGEDVYVESLWILLLATGCSLVVLRRRRKN